MKRVLFTLAIVFTTIMFTSCDPETESLNDNEPQINTLDTGKDEVQDDDV
jgi:hypothetical protein